ncbi:Hypothetical protein AT6N2_L0040 [Agrobacterium tumefaciens]|nr:Hypothetical protein AT6N2_L0040 [Agrobacterium tumefaciens]
MPLPPWFGSEVVLVHVFFGHADPTCAVEQVWLGGVRNQQAFITGQTHVETRLDLLILLLENRDSQHVHGITGHGRIPELDVLDIIVLDVFAGNGNQARSREENLARQAALGDQAASACGCRHRRAENTGNVRIGSHCFLEFGVVGVGVVIGFQPLGRLRHFREVCLLVLDGAVDPFHLRLRSQTANGGDVLALTAHGFAKFLHQVGAIGFVVEGFDVEIDVLDVGSLMADDDDAPISGFLEHRLYRFDRERHDGDRINALCDEVFNDLHLSGGISLAWANHPDIVSGIALELLDAITHAVKPRNTIHLHDSCDGVFLAARRCDQLLVDLRCIDGALRKNSRGRKRCSKRYGSENLVHE